jgi:hypothetical protein
MIHCFFSTEETRVGFFQRKGISTSLSVVRAILVRRHDVTVGPVGILTHSNRCSSELWWSRVRTRYVHALMAWVSSPSSIIFVFVCYDILFHARGLRKYKIRNLYIQDTEKSKEVGLHTILYLLSKCVSVKLKKHPISMRTIQDGRMDERALKNLSQNNNHSPTSLALFSSN